MQSRAVSLQQAHLTALQRMTGLGDRARLGTQIAVDGMQQGAATLAGQTVDGILRQVHRHAV